MTDDERSTASKPSGLSWSSLGSDPIEDIVRAIDNDRRNVARMIDCAEDSLPTVYQTGFNALYRLVENVTGQRVSR